MEGDKLVGVGSLPGAPRAYRLPILGPPLAGMPYPADEVRWSVIASSGVSTVLDLSASSSSYRCDPLSRTSIPLEDLAGGGVPGDEEHERRLIRQAVEEITMIRAAFQGVLVHCVGGRGRTGTVLGAYLVRLGYEPDSVISWLRWLHESRGRPGWPESTWQGNLLREFQ